MVHQQIKQAKRIVVKVGTSTLAYGTGRLNLRRIERLVEVLSDIKNSGKELIFVTSGAIGVGAGVLGMRERPVDTKDKQAAAAVGQCELMNYYGQLFHQYGHDVAQVLLTKDTVQIEKSKENARNTFQTLLEYGVLPIVNANDTISTEEAEFGDNDTLSAIVAKLTDADLLVMLSDINGLYDSDPRKNKRAQLITLVHEIDEHILKSASGAGTKNGTGGMITKLLAAKIATQNGIHTCINNGKNPEILYDILDGKETGTLFVAK